jgi:hypothetical protein
VLHENKEKNKVPNKYTYIHVTEIYVCV